MTHKNIIFKIQAKPTHDMVFYDILNFQRIIFQHTSLCWKAFNLGFHAWIFVASRIKFQDINFKYWYHINSVCLYTMVYYINLKKNFKIIVIYFFLWYLIFSRRQNKNSNELCSMSTGSYKFKNSWDNRSRFLKSINTKLTINTYVCH